MTTALTTIAIVAAVFLFHFAYVDFRFRYREGIVWFWRLSPAPPLMWVGRVLIIAAMLLSLFIGLIGANKTFAIILGTLLVLHLISLILLEVLEPR